MLYLLLSLVVLGIVAALYSYFFRNDTEEIVNSEPSCATCTGDDERCAHDCMLEAAVRDIEYYDDEHLDAYASREADSYTDEEIAEFEEVLYTLRPTDAAGWSRSLTLRNINIPERLRDELIMLINGGQ